MTIGFVAVCLLLLAVAAGIRIAGLYRRLTGVERQASQIERELSERLKIAEQTASCLEAILTGSADAILFCDCTGVCLPLNERACVLLPGPPNSSLLTLSRSSELDSLLQTARVAGSSAGNTPVVGEVVLRAQGERIMQALISRVAGSGSEEPGYLVLLKDVTDLRRLETVRRDFVANVSHELRTPLSSVKAMAETLLDGALEDQAVARHFLETIVRETDRLVHLAADLLDLSRVETQPVVKEYQDIAALIDDIVARLSSQRNKAGVAVHLELDRPLHVPCDGDEIGQVIVNLLDNAYKYTPRGGRVVISSRERNGRVVVEVSDTGIGILQQDLPRLFERFYRTDKARSRQSGGTGLGLSIVKHIVERHGGALWVRSEYNRGSVFGFALPCSEDIAENQSMPQDSSMPGADYVVVGSAQR